jgi:hypothetical protein
MCGSSLETGAKAREVRVNTNNRPPLASLGDRLVPTRVSLQRVPPAISPAAKPRFSEAGRPRKGSKKVARGRREPTHRPGGTDPRHVRPLGDGRNM